MQARIQLSIVQHLPAGGKLSIKWQHHRSIGVARPIQLKLHSMHTSRLLPVPRAKPLTLLSLPIRMAVWIATRLPFECSLTRESAIPSSRKGLIRVAIIVLRYTINTLPLIRDQLTRLRPMGATWSLAREQKFLDTTRSRLGWQFQWQATGSGVYVWV